MRTIDFCGGTRARSRFEATCSKAGLCTPLLYQKIAKALASYFKALIHFKVTWGCQISKVMFERVDDRSFPG